MPSVSRMPFSTMQQKSSDQRHGCGEFVPAIFANSAASTTSSLLGKPKVKLCNLICGNHGPSAPSVMRESNPPLKLMPVASLPGCLTLDRLFKQSGKFLKIFLSWAHAIFICKAQSPVLFKTNRPILSYEQSFPVPASVHSCTNVRSPITISQPNICVIAIGSTRRGNVQDRQEGHRPNEAKAKRLL